MNRLLKTLLLWLLVAVLPLQAVGATMNMSCGSVHGSGDHKAMKAVSPQHERQHGGSHTAHNQHQEASQLAGTLPGSGTSDDSSPISNQYPTCSNCIASCIGASAPPSSAISPATIDGTEMFSVFPALSVIGYTPAGLERPPRYMLA